MKKAISTLCIMLMLCAVAFASTWDPSITRIESDGTGVTVYFDLLTTTDTAQRAEVTIYNSDGSVLEVKKVGKSRKTEKKISFSISHSGSYEAVVTGIKDEEARSTEPFGFEFVLMLEKPQLSVLNQGGGSLLASWKAVDEATGYIVSLDDGKQVSTTGLETLFTGLEIGRAYEVTVTALRGEEKAVSDPYRKTAREQADRQWIFTEFGQSSSRALNTIEMLDSDNLRFRLNSCTYTDASISEKGGKFTAFHDGISFYYTVLDPRVENFSLTATFTIDYINPTADGQEGFGLMALDSLGADGVSSVNHYTNSASIIATKFEETIGGAKKTSKDTLGARFVTGLTDAVIKGGDSMIAKEGTSIGHAYSYDQSDLVKKGDVYTLTLSKDNTGYHCIYRRAIASEDTVEEFILYGADKLSVLDPEHIYVGFAVARGCNATISDVSFTTTSVETDPPAQKEPPTLVPIETAVDSPSTYSSSSYPFVFTANCDGVLRVTDTSRKAIVDNVPIKADEDFTQVFSLRKGINDYQVTFTPKEGYEPFENSRMAVYDKTEGKYVESYRKISISKTVIFLTFEGDTIYASSRGSISAKGTKESPLDLDTAIGYCKPGQTIVILDKALSLSKPIRIERGNDGHEGSYKTLKAESRCILDFTYAGGGMQVWGNWWIIENLDITSTPANVKGLQIAGSNNIVRGVNAYGCGDTGIQISGTSTETFEKWPASNLVELCISHDNCDTAQNNADGFACKLTSADGNVFRNCIAYSNIDDGWDLFTKIESGPIGEVLIENCIAYSNGRLSDGTGNGDGNGFKLGGDGIAVAHLLRNSIAYDNGASGVTSNSNPALKLEAVTSYANLGANFSLYGKKDGPRPFDIKACLSIDGGLADNIKELDSAQGNVFFNGAVSSDGDAALDASIFTSIDLSLAPFIEQGQLVMPILYQDTAYGAHL